MTKPFYLIRYINSSKCQAVRGMHVYEETRELIDDKASVGGAHPYVTKNHKYSITHCHYRPSKKDCGGVIELSSERPSVQLSSPGGEDLDCYWFLKAPPGEHLRLSFEKFNVDGKQGKCKDTLHIQYFRPGQKPYEFCGDRLGRTFQSTNNTITVSFKTRAGSSGSEFAATATLQLDKDLCYNAADRGVSYRGNVNFTRFFEPCLPWNAVQHCNYHPYKFMETVNSSMLFGHNFCRNPDYATGIKPWCYTDKLQCKRNYCDVCLYGKLYDNRDNCAKRKEMGLCTSPELVDVAMYDCAKTCNFSVPPVPIKATENTCGTPPDRVADGKLINTAGPFTVGSSVTYKSDHYNLTRTCLTTGKWSFSKYVHDYCPNGWGAYFATKRCYRYFWEERKSFQDAMQMCQDFGAEIVDPKNSEENKLISDLCEKWETWLGVTDRDEEGVFKNSAGEEISYSNWGKGHPDNWRDKDCSAMDRHGNWWSNRCNRRFPVMCVKPIVDLKVCADKLEICPEMLRAKPSMCVDDMNAVRFCSITCGDCGVDPDLWCNVGPASENSKILTNETRLRRGHVARYACDDGFVPLSGDAVRACAADYKMTGSPLECVEDCPEGWVLHNSTLTCYKFYNIQTTYATALENCRVIGSTLAMPVTLEQNRMIKSQTNVKVWLGIDYIKEKDSFIWANGEHLIGWTQWRYNFDKSDRDNRECTMMGFWANWDIANCGWTNPYVCQFPLQAPTCTVEPAPANAKLVTNATVVRKGAIVKYSCNDGLVPITGDTDRECQADGSLTGAPVQCDKGCPEGSVFLQSTASCYKYNNNRVNFATALQNCRVTGSSLVMPVSLEINELIRKMSNFPKVWIGLNDKEEEGSFKWTNGELLNGWTHWLSDTRKNPKKDRKDCVFKHLNGYWEQGLCRSRFPYICQIPFQDSEL